MSKVEEFFRVEYIEIDDYVKPTVWFGVQGFDLIKQYADGDMSAQKHAEWYVSMFKKAIEAYHQSRVNAISDEEIENIIITAIVTKNPINAVKRIKNKLTNKI